MPIYTPLPWPGENFPQPDIGAVCPFSGNGAEMQRNTGYFPTESLEPSGNRLFSRSALNEGDLFRGSLAESQHRKKKSESKKGNQNNHSSNTSAYYRYTIANNVRPSLRQILQGKQGSTWFLLPPPPKATKFLRRFLTISNNFKSALTGQFQCYRSQGGKRKNGCVVKVLPCFQARRREIRVIGGIRKKLGLQTEPMMWPNGAAGFSPPPLI